MTLKELIDEYRRSPDYKNLRHSTQHIYDRGYAELLQAVSVNSSLHGMDGTSESLDTYRRGILKVRDALADRPALANQFLTAVSVLMNFAVDRGYRQDNPALRIKRLPIGEWKAWTEQEISSFVKRGTRPSTTFLSLGLYTGQRKADIIKLTWPTYSSGCLHITQQKTGKALQIPCHPNLQKELNHLSGGVEGLSGPILRNIHGDPLTASNFSRIWQAEIKRLHMQGLTFHGLRKTAARRLAEAGCTEAEIMAITGHTTTAMVSYYVKQANQKIMADNAMSKLVGYVG